MAVASIHCCLSVPPSNATSSPSGVKLALSPWPPASATARKEESWRGAMSTVACVILGSAVGLAEVGGGWEGFAYADEMREAAAAGAASGPRVVRWSDKRECPPWHTNSLENIVPENLPRPSTRRRSEAVTISRSAPAVLGRAAIASGRAGCYSL
ncbi:unnamed protein product [Spirodela intermedia]|uniref:Uncharacterized protein n=1 Tax=Spirodela intermedia TaxID=51605 RepID=A0A7I8IS61_SPIIN|nr:unnamed protein product [Spirodela intermedia]CAA6660817.1 unnamed protein product [Spirodela intermedia]